MPAARPSKLLGVGINLALRLVIVGVVADALLQPDAARYAGKGIGTRGLVLVAASMVIPALWWFRARRPYPIWTDSLYLSVFALDMAGNFLDLYDRYPYFDLIPHAHGTGAVTVVLSRIAPIGVLGATGVAQAAHILLEAQEYYSDVIFGLRNVRGPWDTINDLLAGLVGSAVYGGAYAVLRRRRQPRRCR
jgi:hypothetical protein